jgi:hypothetical protein
MDVFHDYGTRKQILIMIVGKNHDDSQIKYICIDTTHVRHRQRKQERERERGKELRSYFLSVLSYSR